MTYYDAEIEYLEGTGVQYIDTEIIPTLQYSFECGFYYVSYDNVTDSSATLFGCQSTWITESFTLLVTPSKTGLYNCWGNKYTSIEKSTNTTYWNTLIGVWHTLEFKNKETYIDGIKKLSAVSNTSGEPTLSIHLFNCQRNGNPTFGKGSIKRISYAKIFNENGILLIDLIPVRIGSVGYMYDKVSDRLFGNAGTGSFVLGPDVAGWPGVTGKPKVSSIRRQMIQLMPKYKKEIVLPEGYIKCDWIANTTNCYIDTGVYVNANYSVEAITKISTYASGGWNTMFGTRNGSTSRFTIRDSNNSTSFAFHRSKANNVNYESYECQLNRTDRLDWKTYGIYKNTCKIDGEVIHTFSEATNTTSFNHKLFLFALNSSGAPGDYGYYYMKSCKIWDNFDTLVRNYIPAYEESTKKFGLYDLVNNTFVTSGNNNLFIGNLRNSDLPPTYTEVDYLRFTGNQQIEIISNVSPSDCFEIEWKYNSMNVQQRILSSPDSVLAGNNVFDIYINGSSQYAFNYGAEPKWVTTSTAAHLGRCYVKFDGLNKSFIIYTSGTSKTISLTSYTEAANENKYVIGSRDNANFAFADLYSLKKYENGVLVQDLIPCYNNLGKFGLYDVIQRTFWTSTNNTSLTGGYLNT